QGGNCRATVGRAGGEQGVYVPPDGCSVDAYVHEIGHAVGLWHEHEREDRDRYVMVLEGNLDLANKESYLDTHPANGPYDYASAMHYSLRSSALDRGPAMETIPPGMSVPSASLSPGDIDGVARLYGKPRFGTVISTNPPGLALVVDGIRRIAPLRVNWSDDKVMHTIEAPIQQVAEQTRFLFGSWNIGEQRPGEQRTLSFAGGTLPTWIEANFIVQHPVGAKVKPEGSGRVELQPPSADGYYTDRTLIRAVATPLPGSRYKFWQWGGTLWGNHGRASNPAVWHTARPDKVFEAEFTTRPIVRIESAIDPFVLYVDDDWTYAPRALLADTGRRVKIGVDATADVVGSNGRRYKFNSWSNGEAIAHFPNLAATQGILKVDLQEQFRLSTDVSDLSAGRIAVQPHSTDGFHDKGSVVRLAATPVPGYEFVRWTGSRSSYEPSISASMDRPLHIEAEFSQTRELVPGRAQQVTLPSSNYSFEVFDRESGYRIEVPENAVEVNVRFELSTPRSEVDLFVHAGSGALDWNYGPDGRTPEFKADFRSVRQGSHESVTILHSSDPPLVPGQPYYVSLVRFGARSRVTGSLTAQVRTSPAGIPAAHAAPRAFTFVAPRNARAATHSLRIENQGSGLLRFRIQPNRSWLSVVPSEGVVGPAERQEVSVAADTAGLPSDIYRGTLVVNATGADEAVPSRDLFLPVSLVVLETQSQAVPAKSRESAGVTSPRLLTKVEPN
ncbi:MAG: M12 family metallopeptidase, partial [Bryobacterales bacterium]|nr:M12 family metallopeptidase [Bryobacterales bacterium]